MIYLSNISVQYSGKFIFNEITFQIESDDKIGLVGKNGAGKSSLMKVLTGEIRPENGSVNFPKGTSIGYLPQEMRVNSKLPVLEETAKAFSGILKLQNEIEDLQKKINQTTDHASDDYHKALDELIAKEHQYQLLSGFKMEEQLERVLKGLGFEQEDLSRPMNEFSGGWQMRVELAKILLRKPDLLLLDEPTNHLDIESILWLEDFLKNYSGAVLMVSHDLTFLNSVTRRTIEITMGAIEDYKVPYSRYLELREERREKLIAAKKNQDQVIKQMERNIERFRYKKNKAKFAQTLIRKLDKMERIVLDEMDASSIKIRFPISQASGKLVLTAKNVSKSFGEKEVIKPTSFNITRGQRIAFVGKNGMGKTTLSKILAGTLDYEGDLKWGHNVALGFYAQHQADALDSDSSLLDELEDNANSEMRPKVRSLLGAFLFSGDDVYKRIKVLSGGEKSRLALAKLLLEPLNCLILDEPTNHLDIRSKMILKEALKQFEGTFIVVSHDRDFLTGLTDQVFEFTSKGVMQHIGDINEFLEKKRAADFRMLESAGVVASAKAKKTADNKNDYEERKERDRVLRKLKNKVNNIEKTITKLESQIAEKEESLKDPEQYKSLINDATFFKEYETLKSKLENAMADWEEQSALLESSSEESI